MAHIRLPEGIPGILGPMAFSPETAKPLNALAEVLLRGPNTLTPAERELIATYVSSQNDCYFCQSAHGAVAAHHLGGNEKLVRAARRQRQRNPRHSPDCGCILHVQPLCGWAGHLGPGRSRSLPRKRTAAG